MTDDYNPSIDGAESYTAALKAIRMEKIRAGEITPVISLPWPSKHLFQNTKSHWAVKAKHTKSARTLAQWETKLSGARGNVLHLKFIPPHNRYDLHNIGAASCGKAYIDGVCDAIGINDKTVKVTEEIGAAQKPGRVEITITKGD